MEYYGSCLNQTEKNFYLKIIGVLKSRELSVKAEGITDEDSFSKCISAVKYDYPELFYVDFSHSAYVCFSDGWEYRPNYLYGKEETLRKQKQINKLVGMIVSELKKKGFSSVYQKCGYIHAYLVRNCQYDHAADKRNIAYTAEGPLLQKEGVCQGIAMAYRLICMNCGIEAIVVKGISLQPGSTDYEGHAWNLIRVGENAAHVDVTWDMCLTSKGWPVRYDYFFLPDIEMIRDHQYTGYPVCRNLNSSYFERGGCQFKNMKELDECIEKFLQDNENWDKPGVYFFCFKMSNRKETEEKIQDHVGKLIRQSTDKGYLYSVSVNSPQSVFYYKIEIKNWG